MLSERDRAVVDAYVRTGMSLEVLTASFPKFDRVDIEEVYNKVKNENNDDDESSAGISLNCS